MVLTTLLQACSHLSPSGRNPDSDATAVPPFLGSGAGGSTTASPAPLIPLPLILPRPNVAPAFKGEENRRCYDYNELLVSNGLERFNNEAELLQAVYGHGRVILHHTASNNTPLDIVNFSIKDLGWADVGYHFLITREGKIVTGRSLTYMGANAGKIPNREQDCRDDRYQMSADNDFRSIGVALIGNFHVDTPTSDQLEALRLLLDYLKETYKIQEVIGHNRVKQTLCPGENLQQVYSSFFSDLSEPERLAREESTSPFIRERLTCFSCQ